MLKIHKTFSCNRSYLLPVSSNAHLIDIEQPQRIYSSTFAVDGLFLYALFFLIKD